MHQPAFELALEMGSEGIELDVRLSKDDEIVVIHDDSINRTSNGEGEVSNLTLEQLQQFDYGQWFDERFKNTNIPTLKKVLELLKTWDGLLNIEIKGEMENNIGIEQKIIDVIKNYGMTDRTIISSFNHFYLRNVKEIDSDVKIALLYRLGLVDPWVYANYMGAEALHPFIADVNNELVDGCKKNGILLNTYTVNKEEDMKKMFNLNVDGIVTNYPDKALKVKRLFK